ncbi:hypothetical protein HYY75_11925 [bacterium]|nr:hypothetical protein [bacterium]
MLLQAQLKKLSEDRRSIAIEASRGEGKISIKAQRIQEGGRYKYGGYSLAAKIPKGHSITEFFPIRFLPPSVAPRFASFTSKIDVLGPLRLEGRFSTPGNLDTATATIFLDGTTIVSRLNSKNRLTLGGVIDLVGNSIHIASVSALYDSLKFGVSGNVETNPATLTIKSYDLQLEGCLVEKKAFVLTPEQILSFIPVASMPKFVNISLEGSNRFSGRFSSGSNAQVLNIFAQKARLKGVRKSWWIDDLTMIASTSSPLDQTHFKPVDLDVLLAFRLFDFPLKAQTSLDLGKKQIKTLRADFRGSDFNTLIQALREHPEFEKFYKQVPFNVNGSFQLSLDGAGPLNRPVLSGTLSSPKMEISALNAAGSLPFSITLSTGKNGEYQGRVATKNAILNVRGVGFGLNKFDGNFAFLKPKGEKDNLIFFETSTSVFDTNVSAKGQYSPKQNFFNSLVLRSQSQKIETLATQIARIAKFNLPFKVSGRKESEWLASGPMKALKGSGFLEFDQLDLIIPIKNPKSGRITQIDLNNLAGRLELERSKAGRVEINVKDGRGEILKAPFKISGNGHIEGNGMVQVPVLDKLGLEINSLSGQELQKILSAGVVFPEQSGRIEDVTGNLSGHLSLSGSRNRYLGEGEITFQNGGLRYSKISQSLKNISGKLIFSNKHKRPEPIVELSGFSAKFGRAGLKISKGEFIDPQNYGGIYLEGSAESVYPADLLDLLSGLNLPSLSFPKEGSFSGKLNLSGTFVKPVVALSIDGSPMEVQFISDKNSYLVPIGKSHVVFSYDPFSGKTLLPELSLGLLNGFLEIKNAEGLISGGKPKSFDLSGKIDGIDFGSMSSSGKSALKGVLSGTFKGEQTSQVSKELILNLGIRDLIIPSIPLDKEAIDKIGLDFLDEPEFKDGRINLYLSSEGEITERGRVRVADGLFAGPNMRIEISDSSFDPKNLQLSAKVMFNPQPLRKTKLGKKLGNLTRVLQDRSTGVPYLDLSVSGSWDNPGLMSKKIMEKAKKRGKRNFIKSIFGGRHSHKASVEELKEWFPGWEPGQ